MLRKRCTVSVYSLYQSFRSSKLKASVGTTGDSYDNALAETVNSLYKIKIIEYLKANWQYFVDVKFATLNWVDRFNKKRAQCTGLCIAF